MAPDAPVTVPSEVAEEERVLQAVRANLLRLKAAPAPVDHSATLVELRDSLADEKLADDKASIVEQMDRMQALMNQQAKSPEGTYDLENPYFGRMVLDDDFGTRSILIGKSTFISDRVRIVDWRNAPISRLFYQYGEGDEYDEEVNGRMVSGAVKTKRTMTIAQGGLRRLQTDDHTWVLHSDGWVDARAREAKLAGGAGTAIRPDSLGTGHAVAHGAGRAGQVGGGTSGKRDRHLPEIASLLDPEQFKLITSRDQGLVVIQGSAGSGKTTVGLHRIAWLVFQNPALFRPPAILVVVFSRALAAYISQVLPALGVDGVRVLEYGPWAEALRRAHFRNMPDRYSDDTPALVSRFKSHTALLTMLEAAAKRRPNADPRVLFEELLTDLTWLVDGLARFAPGAFTEREVVRIHRYCTRQMNRRDDGPRTRRKRPIRGDEAQRGFDPDGPDAPDEDDDELDDDPEDPTLDREDDTILLRLWQLVRGPLRGEDKKPLYYDHVMVDEAQDLSPLELAVLIGAAGERQSVTLAGDVAQQVREHREFPSWIDVLGALRLGHVDVSPLQVSYRSTRQIMEVARRILGPLAPDEPVTAPRMGAPVGHLRFDSKGAAATWLAPALADLMQREPMASVAVLTVDLAQALDWYGILERSQVPHLALIVEQDFSFAPGVEVSDIRSSKGLEFDYVVLVGVDQDAFPARDQARHLLHVGATRAAHQLWIVSTGTPSALVPEGLPGLEGAG